MRDLLSGDSPAWAAADEISWGLEPYPTEFRALWSPDGLHLRFDATDPDPWHTMVGRDDHLWEEEVVEIFLDPSGSGRNYAELEINPANVVCDVLMREPWPAVLSDLAWDFAGLETRVVPLAREPGRVIGWTALARLPWSGFRSLPSIAGVALPPAIGDRWRFNVFRIKRPGGKEAPEHGAILAAWSAPRGFSFHDPAAFRELIFAGR